MMVMPFKCRYCGKSFCSKHRIPENHECTFEFKDDPYLVKPVRTYQDIAGNNYTSDSYYRNTPNQPKSGSKIRRNSRSMFGPTPKLKATYYLMGITLVFFIISISGLNQFVALSITDFMHPNYSYYTLITSVFLSESLFSLIFDLLILWFLGRTIEGRFGSKVFVQIYMISGLITGIAVIILQSVFNAYPVIYEETISGFSTSMGATMGLLTFIILLVPKIPIKFKPVYVLYFYIGLNLIIGSFSQLTSLDGEYYYIVYYASIFGCLGGYLKIRSLKKAQQRFL